MNGAHYAEKHLWFGGRCVACQRHGGWMRRAVLDHLYRRYGWFKCPIF